MAAPVPSPDWLTAGFAHWGRLFVVGLLVGILTVVGFILLIIPGLIVIGSHLPGFRDGRWPAPGRKQRRAGQLGYQQRAFLAAHGLHLAGLDFARYAADGL